MNELVALLLSGTQTVAAWVAAGYMAITATAALTAIVTASAGRRRAALTVLKLLLRHPAGRRRP
jgi:hypothetical protein